MVGNRVSFGTDCGETISVLDPRPFQGPVHRQAAVMTEDASLLLRQITIENRQAPIMVPPGKSAPIWASRIFAGSHRWVSAFFEDHPRHAHAAEVRLLLAMAFNEAGYGQQAERQLELMLESDELSELSGHALFELACLRIDEEAGKFDRAIRTVLSYQQEQGVRARFSLWLGRFLAAWVLRDDLRGSCVSALHQLMPLLRGFADEQAIKNALSIDMKRALPFAAARLVDLGNDGRLDLMRVRLADLRCNRPAFAPDLTS